MPETAEAIPSERPPSPRHRVPGKRPERLRLIRRAGWNLGDQVLSAVTNVVLSFMVARAIDAEAFGAFSIAFVIFTLLVGLERALVGQPLSIVHSKATIREMGQAIRAATATTLVMGVLVGAGALVVGLAVGGVTGGAIVAVGVVLPGLVMQDCCRMVFFAQLRPVLATLNDTVWAVVQFSGMGILLGSNVKSVAAYVLVWGGSAYVASVVGLVQLGHLPAFQLVRGWVRDHRTLSGYLIAEYVLGAGAYQSGVFLVGAFAGVQAVGSLRAAQVLIGPTGILATGLFTFALPELARRSGTLSSGARVKVAALISGGLVVSTALYGTILLLFPDDLGKKLLGDTWTGASDVLLPVVVGSVVLGISLGPAIVAYSMGRARLSFQLHLIEAPILVVCVIGGVHFGGVREAAWGMALAFGLMVPLWMVRVHRLLYPPPGKTVTSEHSMADAAGQTAVGSVEAASSVIPNNVTAE